MGNKMALTPITYHMQKDSCEMYYRPICEIQSSKTYRIIHAPEL